MPELQQDYIDQVRQEATRLYHQVKAIYAARNYEQSYELSQIWEGAGQNMNDMTGVIESGSGAVESIRATQRTYMFSINPPAPIKERMVDWYLSYLGRSGHDLAGMGMSIQESLVTDPALLVNRGGRILTADFLRTVVLSLEIREHCQLPARCRIVELGGGCGYLARTLKLFMPSNVYVDIDLPETLFFSYMFHRLNFPEARVCYVTDPSELKGNLDSFDFVFIPTLFADSILEYDFDIFCNTASMGEMPNATIRQWMDFVQNKLKVKYFFGLNRMLNTLDLSQRFSHRRLNENECSVLFDAGWRILQWEVEPPFARCPYEDPNVSRNLAIIAERRPAAQATRRDDGLASQKLVEDVLDEDWMRCPDTFIHGTMRSNILVNDLTMSGTLFKLWESIRLYPNRTSVAMMIIYLRTLARTNFPFEEWFYYKDLLAKLLQNSPEPSPGITLLDPKYEPVWKRAAELSTIYDGLGAIDVAREKRLARYLGAKQAAGRLVPAFMRPGVSKLGSLPLIGSARQKLGRKLFYRRVNPLAEPGGKKNGGR